MLKKDRIFYRPLYELFLLTKRSDIKALMKMGTGKILCRTTVEMKRFFLQGDQYSTKVLDDHRDIKRIDEATVYTLQHSKYLQFHIVR